MIEPGVITVVKQLEKADCAVACLAMMLGVSYSDVWWATSKRVRAGAGMTDYQIMHTAKKLGCVVRWRNAPPEDDEFGMLYLTKPKTAHVALHLRGGTVIDPADGLIYTDVKTFHTIEGWKVSGFYWRES